MSILSFTIILSLLILPLNFLCIRWMRKRALELTGMTLWECIKLMNQRETEETEFTDKPPRYTDPEELELSERTGRMKPRQRKFAFFIHGNSTNPKESFRLLKLANCCMLFGALGLPIAEYAQISSNPHKVTVALICDAVLILLNLGIFIAGRIYSTRHPLDENLAEKLRIKRSEEKAERNSAYIKSVIFFAVFLCAMISIVYFAGSKLQNSSEPNAPAEFYISTSTVKEILNGKGYETRETPVTYWEYDESKLMYVCAGVEGESKFEFYDYSDGETVDGVYNMIVYGLTENWENADRDAHQMDMPDGGKRFHAIIDGVHQLCIYREDVLIYAYSPKGLEEINEILGEIGFIKTN